MIQNMLLENRHEYLLPQFCELYFHQFANCISKVDHHHQWCRQHHNLSQVEFARVSVSSQSACASISTTISPPQRPPHLMNWFPPISEFDFHQFVNRISSNLCFRYLIRFARGWAGAGSCGIGEILHHMLRLYLFLQIDTLFFFCSAPWHLHL